MVCLGSCALKSVSYSSMLRWMMTDFAYLSDTYWTAFPNDWRTMKAIGTVCLFKSCVALPTEPSPSLGHVSPGGHPTINDDQHRLVDLRLGIRRYPRLLQFDPTAPFQPLVGGLITMLFHGFYAWRMWTMSRNVILPILICMVCAIHDCSSTGSCR